LALGEDDPGELVGGRLVEEEVPDAVHELTVSWFIRIIGTWLGSRGFIFGSELKILIDSSTGRKPDAVVFLDGTPAPPKRGPIVHPPDIVIEVVTPSPRDERRDRVEKMTDYAGLGIGYYWLVDPALGSFEIFGLTGSATYEKLVGVTGGRVTDIPSCPDLAVDLDALWRELARLGD
jgi:Uma2 family endonuclease